MFVNMIWIVIMVNYAFGAELFYMVGGLGETGQFKALRGIAIRLDMFYILTTTDSRSTGCSLSNLDHMSILTLGLLQNNVCIQSQNIPSKVDSYTY